jgi:O-antigen ligase
VRLSARRGDALARRFGRGVLSCLLVLVPLVFSRHTLEAFEFPKVLLLLTAAVVLAAGAAAMALERGLVAGPGALRASLGHVVRHEPLAWGVLLYVASAALSTAASISPRTSWRGAPESFFGLPTVLAYAVLYFGVRVLCAAPVHARALVHASLVGATGAGLYGLVQFAGLDPVAWTRTHEFLGLARAFGSMGNPNFLGALMAMSLPLSLSLALRSWRRAQRGRAALLAASALVSLAALGVSLSRGAWLAGAAGLALWALGQVRLAGRPEARRRLLLAAAAGLLILGVAVARVPRARDVGRAMLARLELNLAPGARERPVGAISLEQDPRLALWRAAWSMFRERPLTGVGLDAFQLAFQSRRELAIWEVEGQRTPGKAHNELLHALATQGLPGALALGLIAVGGALALRRALDQQPGERELLVGIAASLLAFFVQAQFSFTVAGCGTLALALLGLAAGLGRPAPPPPTTAPLATTTPARTLALSLGQAAVAALGLVALWFCVARPLRADYAAQQGVQARAQNAGLTLPYFAEAVRLDPGRDLYWTHLGVAHHDLAQALPDPASRAAQLGAAREAFERALALVPINGYTQGGLARVLFELQRLQPPRASLPDVWAAFERALALDPRNPYWPVEAGRYALQAGDGPRARAWAQRSLDLHPRYGPAACLLHNVDLEDVVPLLGAVDANSRRAAFDPVATGLRAAVTDLRWYEENDLRAMCASQAAAALVAADRLDEARAAAELATHVDPNFADAHYNLGRIYERLGDARAGAEYRLALRLRPGHPEARRALEALERVVPPAN